LSRQAAAWGSLIAMAVVAGTIALLSGGRGTTLPNSLLEGTPTAEVTASPTPAAFGAVNRDDGRGGNPSACTTGAPCLHITVEGNGSVQVVSSEIVCPPACDIELGLGVVDIQRTNSLDPEQEESARLVEWGGDCALIAARTLPRGGVCEVMLDQDRHVRVRFEDRPRLAITVTGVPGRSFELTPQTEQMAGNSSAYGRRTCAPTPCTYSYFYDLNTEVLITPNPPAFMHRWGGECADTAAADRAGNPAAPCSVLLNEDTQVSLLWSDVRCESVIRQNVAPVTNCTFDPDE